MAGGCQSQTKPATSASVLEVSSPTARSNYYQQPVSQQPVTGYQPTGPYAANPTPAATTTPPYMLPSAYPPPEPIPSTVSDTQPPVAVRASARARAVDGSRYTVKPGDTLYHIAKVRYGDGKQWQQIASANPGVSPTSLKVGQVLVIP